MFVTTRFSTKGSVGDLVPVALAIIDCTCDIIKQIGVKFIAELLLRYFKEIGVKQIKTEKGQAPQDVNETSMITIVDKFLDESTTDKD